MDDVHSILWRRLDAAGHDACRVFPRDGGWEIDGTAVFNHNRLTARLSYSLTCDRTWRTRRGHVHGFVGPQVVDLSIERTANGTWTVDGRVAFGLEACLDLDFGFTPATNLSQLRRLQLTDGQAADVPVAWLDVPPAAVRILQQRYERRGELAYWYEAPEFGYAALLELTPAGFIRRYPGLWEIEDEHFTR